MVKDKVSNLINGLKNANLGNKAYLNFEYSNLIKNILDLLSQEGYIESFEVKEKNSQKEFKIILKYTEKNPAIHGVKRVSKLSKRIYRGTKDITSIKNGFGMAVITTPLGLMSDKTAREKKVGGEILFEIW